MEIATTVALALALLLALYIVFTDLTTDEKGANA